MAARRNRPAASGRKPAEREDSGSGPIEPEVLGPDEATDEDEDEDEDDEDRGSGPVIELESDARRGGSGGSYGTQPAGSSASLPVLRGAEGVARIGPLQAFLRQVGQYPLLSAEEEQVLAIKVFEDGDPQAAHKLAVHNLRLVVKMAYRYRRAWASMLDLIQEGNVGLIEAVRRFDPFKGARFSTYAAYWIRAYMLRFLLDHSRMVRISRTRAGRKLFFRLSKERERLRALGVEPGPKLLAESLGVSQKDFDEVVRHMDQPEVRLDAPIGLDSDSGATVLDTMSAGGETPESAAHRRALADDVSTAFESFAQTLKDDRERAAWFEHMLSDEPTSLSELGERFGVTKQRMGQIVTGIRKRLKDHLIATLGPDVELGYTMGPDA